MQLMVTQQILVVHGGALRAQAILQNPLEYRSYSTTKRVELHVGQSSMLLCACAMCEEACEEKASLMSWSGCGGWQEKVIFDGWGHISRTALVANEPGSSRSLESSLHNEVRCNRRPLIVPPYFHHRFTSLPVLAE